MYEVVQADAWSVGVTLYQACFGALPFQLPAKALDPIREMSLLHADWVRSRRTPVLVAWITLYAHHSLESR